MRTANSLDSLDCVTSSIQQARASSLQRREDSTCVQWTASPQLVRINRSNSMRSVKRFSNLGLSRRIMSFLSIILLVVEMID